MPHTLLNHLMPRPRHIAAQAHVLRLGHTGRYMVRGTQEQVASAEKTLCRALGEGWQPGTVLSRARLVFQLMPGLCGPQAYRLRVSPQGVLGSASDEAGLRYAAVTFAQLMRLGQGVLPCCEIADAPDLPVRGVMLDISRDKVPTQETLYDVVDDLADLKINQLQLYIEHTFAYRGHETVWRGASPMTASEIRALDRYCRARCVTLVPNQNSFGHMERWLKHARYQSLAELPQGGAPLPWGGTQSFPSALCPSDPGALSLLADLYDQLLPNFTATLFNAGCDETFDLRGNGRSAALVRSRGEGRVYLDFLKKIHALITARGRRMAFWGDIILRHPELVSELPKEVLALVWGYEADHPFQAHAAQLAASRVPFYVVPGTSSWNSLAGRTANMRANLEAAVRSGLRHGACGCLIADWGDGGHWQPLAVSLAGFVYGAALAWGFERNHGCDLEAAMNRFGGAAGAAEALLRLGDVYLRCGARRGNGSELFMLLANPRARPVAAGVTCATLHDVLDEVSAAEQRARAVSHPVIAAETAHVIRLVRAACHRGIALLDPRHIQRAARRERYAEMAELMAAHEAVWLLRNRPGGLRDSSARMARIRDEYAT